MIELPAFRVTQGLAATYEYTWTGSNLTGHSGAVIIQDKSGEELWTGTASLTSGGAVSFTVPATTTDDFPALSKPGYFVTGRWQVKITGATYNETFTGPLAVAGEL